MNYPLKNGSSALDNVSKLREALESDGYTLSIRVAIGSCLRDYHDGLRSAEAGLAIAIAKIACTPQPMQREYANTYWQDATSLSGYTPGLAIEYSQLCIRVLTSITGRSNASLGRELRMHYEVALAAETERLKALMTTLVPA